MGLHFPSSVRAARSSKRLRHSRPRVELLEVRCLLAAGLPDLVTAPAVNLQPQAGAATGPGLSVPQIRHAYGFDAIAWGATRGDGAGQTIALVVATDYPSIVSDLTYFDRSFALPDAPQVRRVAPQGVPAVDPTWALEAALDVEWAHAIAPGANILLVEAHSSGLSDMLNAVDWARNQAGVSVVSLSWGTSEFSVETYYDAYFTTPAGHTGVTFVAASGDNGGLVGASWPAISSNVLSVGGTRLSVDAKGTYLGETAWAGSGGAVSLYENRPAYQNGIQGNPRRTSPDVAYDADTTTGVAVFTSTPYNGRTGWFMVGGTSASAPQWAGLVAVANQGRALKGLPALDGVQNAVYQMPALAYHDITQGSNGRPAGPGYDLATGRGSPYADRIVSYLVSGTISAPASAATNTAPVTTNPTPLPAPTSQVRRVGTYRFALVAGDEVAATVSGMHQMEITPISAVDQFFVSGEGRQSVENAHALSTRRQFTDEAYLSSQLTWAMQTSISGAADSAPLPARPGEAEDAAWAELEISTGISND